MKISQKWTDSQVTVLINMIDRQMKRDGFTNFTLIAEKLGRTAKSCNQKAYGIGLKFQTKQQQIPENAPKPRYDMMTLPKHKGGLHVDYWEGKPNTKRVNYPAVWETLRSKICTQ